MTSPKVLVVEDNEDDLATFRSTLDRYSEEKKDRKFIPVYAVNLGEAIDKLDNSFDGAIIDLRLNGDSNAGNEVIEKIIRDYRIPVVVFTGTPEKVGPRDLVEIFKKGEIQYDVILDKLYEIYQTGLTKIFGGRGYLEETMNTIFWLNIFPIIETWKTYCAQGRQTEKALLRYTISHMIEALGIESELYFPEEMYIAPPISNDIKTGSVIKMKDADDYYIVLSPACDMVIHSGNYKTDHIMVCAIEDLNMSLVVKAKEDEKIEIRAEDDDQVKIEKGHRKTRAKDILSKLPRNSYSMYFHFLPKTGLFPGGFVNFRKIETYKLTDFKQKFENPSVQISSAFVKDIISRLSTYYARQGQPDFDFDSLTF